MEVETCNDVDKLQDISSSEKMFLDDESTNDVENFLMRPPVSKQESQKVEDFVTTYFDKAMDMLTKHGPERLLDSNHLFFVSSKDSEGNGSILNDQSIQTSIEEAVVKGSPRDYQKQLFEKAKLQNTIINLGTGQGKTLIAFLLIRHYSKAYEEGKQTLFLVPSIALAVQHTTTLRANLPFKVATACHTSSNSDKARQDLRESNIIVATHGAALDLLRHYSDFFSMSKTNLVVLDECHYATGSHGYARIMEMFYYRTPVNKRPRVLGLTASPLVNVRPSITQEKLEEMICQLEKTLDAKLAGYFQTSTKSAEEKVVHYKNKSDPNDVLPPHEKIGLHYSRIKELNQLASLYSDFGPKVTGEYCECLVREISRYRYEKETARQYERIQEHLTFLVQFCKHQCLNSPSGGVSDKLQVLEQLLIKLLSQKKDQENDDTVGVVFVERRITALALHEYLRNKYKKNLAPGEQTIIKCDMIVRHSTQVFKYLHPSHKIGIESYKPGDEWLHQMKKVRDVLEGLRSKQTNVLIATSVVEEGVDVDACSFVIVLDHIKTSKGYVQMKGRARRENAKFYVFENNHPESNPPPISLSQAQEVEQRVRSFIETRVNNLSEVIETAKVNPYTGPSSSLEIKALHEGEYRAPKGCVEECSAKSLLNRYSLSIPLDNTSRSSRHAMLLHMPIYEGYRLIMPAHLPADVRVVVIPEALRPSGPVNKKQIYNKLALMACVRLHSLNLLNDRLLPLRRRDMHERLLTVALQQLPQTRERRGFEGPPKEPKQIKTVHVYAFHQASEIYEKHNEVLQGGRGLLCFVAISPLVDIPDFIYHHHEFEEVVLSLGQKRMMKVSKEEWDIMSEFYTKIITYRWKRRTRRHRFRYAQEKQLNGVIPPLLVSLLKDDGEFDYERMKTINMEYDRTEEERMEAMKKFSSCSKPRMCVPVYDKLAPYVCVGTTSLNSSAPFPYQKDIGSYADYLSKKRGHELKDKNSPMLAMQRMWQLPRRMQKENFVGAFGQLPGLRKRKAEELEQDEAADPEVLQEGEINPLTNLATGLLPREVCMETQLGDASLFLQTILLPQMIYHVERILISATFVQHCKDKLPVLGSYIEKLKLSDVLECLTAKSCSMTITYDRFEYLGDAVLKLLHTDALLASRDLQKWVAYLHEGDLTTLRSAMGSNDRLKDAALSTGLEQFILTKPLGRGQWVPPGIEAYLDERDGPITEELLKKDANNIQMFIPSHKVCADVIEAILGIVYLDFGYEASVKVAEELGISLPKNTENDEPNDKDKANKDHTAIHRELKNLATEFLDYGKFDNESLLLESLTHPSCIHEEVPCYQRLEWIGDAVLCLAAREWVFHNFPEIHVSELVVIETSLVCNETLAYLGYLSGVHRHINHRDPSLPRRFEEYERNLEEFGRGLWGTDPPKVIPDVVEALLGASHCDGGFEVGQRCALFILRSVLSVVKKQLCDNDPNLLKSQTREMMHPKQVIHEMAGRHLQVRTCREDVFAIQNKNCPVWRGNSWGFPNQQSSSSIGQVICSGMSVLAVAESTSVVAKNRACSLAVAFFTNNPVLLENVLHISSRVKKDDYYQMKDSEEDEYYYEL